MDDIKTPHMDTPIKKEIVCFGEVLWDVFPSGKVPGGAPMNVAYHLHKQKRKVGVITKIGIDDDGKKLFNFFSKKGICTDYFQIDHKYDTGKVIAKTALDNETIYDFKTPAAWDYILWDDAFEELMANARLFVFGSLATRGKTSASTLFRLLDLRPTGKVMDINLRSGFYSKEIIQTLLEKVDILKLNEAELELITGWFSGYQSNEDRLRALSDRFKIPTAVVTMGSNGAMLLKDGQIDTVAGLKVEVTDTVGAGDAFLAGFLSKLLPPHGSVEDTINPNPREALEFGNQLGAFVATQRGSCPNYEIEELQSRFKN